MRRRIDGLTPADTMLDTSETQLRRNVEQLMEFYGWTQTQLAERLGKDQAWVSRHLSGKPPPLGARFQFRDLDALAAVFGLSPAELLQPGLAGGDRRAGHDRRSGVDRRVAKRHLQTISPS